MKAFHLLRPDQVRYQKSFIFLTLVPKAVADIVVVATGDSALAQTTDLIVSTDTGEGSTAASGEETLVAPPTFEVAVIEHSAFTSTSKAHVVTLEMRELLVRLHLQCLVHRLHHLKARLPPSWKQDRQVLRPSLR